MLDDSKTIRMTNLTQSLKEGKWNIEYWPGYGFTANNRTTTNGSLSLLLRCVHTPENQAAVMQFAREVAKTDSDAARQVARIDPNGIFSGNIYGGHVLRPARRRIKGGQHGTE